ncbi:MAG TPA: CmcI family methyltransferase, partial [Fimbriimonadaceae bacterium]|nr:CmcI family methyltransferase [Fimbriimonadaceae bacterium]
MDLHALHSRALADLEKGTNVSEDLADLHSAWSASPHTRYYSYLHGLCRLLKPKRVLELGTFRGQSARALLTALESDAQLVTVDQSGPATFLHDVKGDPRLVQIIGDDLDPDVLEKVKAEAGGEPFDLIFIDTDHTLEQIKKEWAIYSSHFAEDAVVVLDDIHLNGGLEWFWERLPYEKIDTGDHLHHTGFGLLRFDRSKGAEEPHGTKIAVAMVAHDDYYYMAESLRSYATAGDLIVFASRTPWHGTPGDWERCVTEASEAGAEAVLGDWHSEDEHRRHALRELRKRGYSHALIVDGDEIIEPELLRKLVSIAENQLATRVAVEMQTYWKTPEYCIRPRERITPVVLVDLRQVHQVHIRDYEGGELLVLNHQHGLLHHLSYVGPNERIARKLQTWGHHHEVLADWYSRIWRAWDADKLMRNLHPTHPEAYGFAERIPLPELLAPVARKCLLTAERSRTCEPPPSWPQISVVIPLHGGVGEIRQCLQSLTDCGHLFHEIIVIDDKSPDEAALDAVAFEEVKLIKLQENVGFAGACNHGMRQASGDVVLLLNSDTVVTAPGILRLIESLTSSGSVGAAGPLTNNSGHHQQIDPTYTTFESLHLFAEDFALREVEDREVDTLVGFCLAVKRNVLNEVGLLDERFGAGTFEDNDLSYRIRRAGYRLLLSMRSFIHHHGSMTFRRERIDLREQLAKNYHLFVEKWKDDLELGFASHLSGLGAQPIVFRDDLRPEKVRERMKRRAKQADISLCMIVKNEERVLADCLESAAPFFSEIIVVDTGSTDQTVAIAEKHGAKVYHFPWIDSFSE